MYSGSVRPENARRSLAGKVEVCLLQLMSLSDTGAPFFIRIIAPSLHMNTHTLSYGPLPLHTILKMWANRADRGLH